LVSPVESPVSNTQSGPKQLRWDQSLEDHVKGKNKKLCQEFNNLLLLANADKNVLAIANDNDKKYKRLCVLSAMHQIWQLLGRTYEEIHYNNYNERGRQRSVRLSNDLYGNHVDDRVSWSMQIATYPTYSGTMLDIKGIAIKDSLAGIVLAYGEVIEQILDDANKAALKDPDDNDIVASIDELDDQLNTVVNKAMAQTYACQTYTASTPTGYGGSGKSATSLWGITIAVLFLLIGMLLGGMFVANQGILAQGRPAAPSPNVTEMQLNVTELQTRVDGMRPPTDTELATLQTKLDQLTKDAKVELEKATEAATKAKKEAIAAEAAKKEAEAAKKEAEAAKEAAKNALQEAKECKFVHPTMTGIWDMLKTGGTCTQSPLPGNNRSDNTNDQESWLKSRLKSLLLD